MNYPNRLRPTDRRISYFPYLLPHNKLFLNNPNYYTAFFILFQVKEKINSKMYKKGKISQPVFNSHRIRKNSHREVCFSL